MSRIAPLQEPLEPEAAELLGPMMPPGEPPIGLFRTFGRNPAMTTAMQGWGSYCLSRRLSVGMRTREIVIHRVTARCGCEYEFGVHAARFAVRVGLTAAQLRSLAHGGPADPCWTDPADRAVVALADQLHDTSTVDDPLWSELAALFTEAQLLDLLLLAGWYHAISFAANAAGVAPEPGAPSFAALR